MKAVSQAALASGVLMIRMKQKSEKGFMAITAVLIIGAIVLILGISLFHSALTDYSISTAYESGQKAAFLADYCLREGILKLQEDIDYLGGEEISVNDAKCTINFVKQVDENTKEVSSLGRAGDQPHFSRASQRLRYIIESTAEDWGKGEFDNKENFEIGDSLKLKSVETEIIRKTPEDRGWEEVGSILQGVEVSEYGTLVLAGLEPPPEEPKKENDEPCESNDECQSGLCESVVKDADQEGYSVLSAATRCVGDSTTVSGRTYYKDSDNEYTWLPSGQSLGTDCYDLNANARPGQASCFAVERGTEDDAAGNTGDSYDYNCQNGDEKCVICYASNCSTAQPCGYVGSCYVYDSKLGCWTLGIEYTVECR